MLALDVQGRDPRLLEGAEPGGHRRPEHLQMALVLGSSGSHQRGGRHAADADRSDGVPDLGLLSPREVQGVPETIGFGPTRVTLTASLAPRGPPPGARNLMWVDIADMGDDKEAYRWNFLIKNHRQREGSHFYLLLRDREVEVEKRQGPAVDRDGN